MPLAMLPEPKVCSAGELALVAIGESPGRREPVKAVQHMHCETTIDCLTVMCRQSGQAVSPQWRVLCYSVDHIWSKLYLRGNLIS